MKDGIEQLRAARLNALFTASCDALEAGRAAQAKRGFASLLKEFAAAPLLESRYGLACYALKEYAEAKRAFQRAVELEPCECGHLFNLGLALRRLGENSDAEKAWREVVQREPESGDALYNLAGLLRESVRLDRRSEAIQLYRRVVALEPENAAACNNLASLLHREGLHAEAVEQYRRVVALRPDDGGARHMLAALTGGRAETPSPDYVATLFDSVAAHFDQHLTDRLGYRVPQLLFRMYRRYGDRKRASLLDLGCGTGLCGAAFAGAAATIDGVDLSAKMVAKAAERGIYRRLEVAELVAFLEAESGCWQLFTAADVCNYFADLQPLFAAVAQRAETGAFVFFSSEEGTGDAVTLGSSGRFCHAPEPLRIVLGSCGFDIVGEERAQLREEAGQPVCGRLWCVRRS